MREHIARGHSPVWEVGLPSSQENIEVGRDIRVKQSPGKACLDAQVPQRSRGWLVCTSPFMPVVPTSASPHQSTAHMAAAEMTKCLISSLECPDEVSGCAGLTCAQKDPNNSARLTHTKELSTGQERGQRRMQWSHLPIHTGEEVLLGGPYMGEEVFVKRPVLSWGHLLWQADIILAIGNAQNHMVGGLLMSAGCPGHCSHWLCQTGRREGDPEPSLLSSGPGWASPLSSLHITPPHLPERGSASLGSATLIPTLQAQVLGTEDDRVLLRAGSSSPPCPSPPQWRPDSFMSKVLQ